MVPFERHLLGDGEVVLLWLLPVDEADGFRTGVSENRMAEQIMAATNQKITRVVREPGSEETFPR